MEWRVQSPLRRRGFKGGRRDSHTNLKSVMGSTNIRGHPSARQSLKKRDVDSRDRASHATIFLGNILVDHSVFWMFYSSSSITSSRNPES